MRRFSQRNSLVTLSDINITPLLDLAFVLMIIFMIISPTIRPKQDHSMDLNLPKGGGLSRQVETKDVKLVEISPEGRYTLNGQTMDLPRIEQDLVATFRSNPNLIVKIRADQKGLNMHLYAVMNICTQNGITKFSLDTEPESR